LASFRSVIDCSHPLADAPAKDRIVYTGPVAPRAARNGAGQAGQPGMRRCRHAAKPERAFSAAKGKPRNCRVQAERWRQINHPVQNDQG
jgi:hypothetical protein